MTSGQIFRRRSKMCLCCIASLDVLAANARVCLSFSGKPSRVPFVSVKLGVASLATR